MTVILINSSENIEDHKDSQERICDVSGENSNTLLMRKLRFIKEKCFRSLSSDLEELGLVWQLCSSYHTSVYTIRPRSVLFQEGYTLCGGAD